MKGPVLLIGAGRMGGALLKGWMKKGIGPLAAVEPVPTLHLRNLAKAGSIALFGCVEEFHGGVRACVVALKPQVLKTQAAELRAIAQSSALMISIAAGTNLRALRAAWGREARIVRAMPNMPGAIGHGISALYSPTKIGRADRRTAESLLAALGETLWVARESHIDAVTAVSGSGPAYVFLLAEALERAALAEGLPAGTAKRLARATVAGAGAMLEAEKREPAELRRDVTSPGGTTEAALRILAGPKGLSSLIARAVRAAAQRAQELTE